MWLKYYYISNLLRFDRYIQIQRPMYQTGVCMRQCAVHTCLRHPWMVCMLFDEMRIITQWSFVKKKYCKHPKLRVLRLMTLILNTCTRSHDKLWCIPIYDNVMSILQLLKYSMKRCSTYENKIKENVVRTNDHSVESESYVKWLQSRRQAEHTLVVFLISCQKQIRDVGRKIAFRRIRYSVNWSYFFT